MKRIAERTLAIVTSDRILMDRTKKTGANAPANQMTTKKYIELIVTHGGAK